MTKCSNHNIAESTLVNATTVAKYLRIHRATVYRMAKEGRIPSIQLGGAIRFDLQEVLNHLIANSVVKTDNQ